MCKISWGMNDYLKKSIKELEARS